MTPERWQRIEEILDKALPLDEEARARLLDEECGDDTSLRREVELYIAAWENAKRDGFLDKPPLPPPPPDDFEPGAFVGPYVIVRLVGRGGMGDVYLAERADGQFYKQVALNVVKRGMDTHEILQRFRYEREILARLEHPHIAQLHDGGGTEDGRPYFAMEYVEGEPLDEYCDRKRLSVRARLELFVTVCEAVRYAHRNLVVHRDLKPSNILVSEDEAGQPQVKLLDFGIAKLLEHDPTFGTLLQTQPSEQRLTPSYAAPEQVRGERTSPATDVYALGVLLYKLLTGRRPYRFDSYSSASLEQVICHTMPEKPSTIVLRPAEQDENGEDGPRPELFSEERATSPRMLRHQLKGDLDAIILMALRKEPQQRYPAAARLLDDIERYLDNRPVEAQPEAVAYRASKFVQRNKAGVVVGVFAFLGLIGLGTTLQQANTAAQQAEREAERADATLGMARSMLLKVNPESGQGTTFTVHDLIEAALPEINALEDQPRAQAQMMNELGRVTLQVGLVDLADSLHRKALDIQHLKLDTDDPDVAESLMRLAEVYYAQGEPEEAERTYKQSIAINPLYGPVHTNLGLFYLGQDRFEEAIAQLQKYTDLEPDDARGYNNLGAVYYYLDRRKEARQMWERTIELDPSHFRAHSNLATLHNEAGRYIDAARIYEKAIALNHQSFEHWGYLAAAYYWTPENRDKAFPTYQHAIKLAEAMLRDVNPDDTDVLSRLATYYAMIRERDKALAYIERALTLASEDRVVLLRASDAYEQLGERELALHWLEKALAHGHPSADIEGDPAFRELRADPRYQQILPDSSDAP